MAAFTVDIFTPSKVIAREVPADTLLVPTVRGQINILPEHTHLVTQLDTGSLECLTPSGGNEFFVTTGIVKVLKNKVTILADVAEARKDIDGERAKVALEKAKSMLNGNETLSDKDLVKYRRKMSRALQRSELSK